jgi:hypothetical protein
VSAVNSFKANTSAAITTSEPIYEYSAAISGSPGDLNYCPNKTVYPGLLSLGDYTSPNIYCYYGLERQNATECHYVRSAQANASWTFDQMQMIQAHSSIPAFIHETGYPTDSGESLIAIQNGGGCTQQQQADYFCALQSHTSSFSHFRTYPAVRLRTAADLQLASVINRPRPLSARPDGFRARALASVLAGRSRYSLPG